MLRYLLLAALVFELSGTVSAAELKPATVAAFDHYVQLSEQRMTTEMPGTFLLIDSLPVEQRDAAYIRLRAGEVITARLDTLENGKPIPVPSGLIHHWRGLSFVKGTTLNKTLAFLQDYDHQDKYYAPDVQRSKLLLHNGDDFKIFLRLRKHKVVTVILNTEYDVRYMTLDPSRSTSRALSTRIAEVENTGKPGSHLSYPRHSSRIRMAGSSVYHQHPTGIPDIHVNSYERRLTKAMKSFCEVQDSQQEKYRVLSDL